MESRLLAALASFIIIAGSAHAVPGETPPPTPAEANHAVSQVSLLLGAAAKTSDAAARSGGTAAGDAAAIGGSILDILAGAAAAVLSGVAGLAVGFASGASDILTSSVGALASGASAIGAGLAGALAALATLATAGAQVLSFAAASLGAGAAWLASLGNLLLSSAAAAVSLVVSQIASVAASLSRSASRISVQIDPRTAVYGGAATAGAVGTWLIADWIRKAGLLAPLYTRLAPSRLLDNEVRQRIFRFIEANPGAHVSAIRDQIGIGWGTTVYHLSKLRAAHMVTTVGSGNQVCYYKNGCGVSAADQRAIPLLKNAKARAIREYLMTNPGTTQRVVAEELGMSAALVSWHVARLEEAGLLDRVRDGRVTRLALRASGPAPAAA